MKKFIAIATAATLAASLAGCGATATASSTASSDTAASTASSTVEAASTAESDAAKSYRIAIVQQLDHASLDEIRLAMEAELNAKAAAEGYTVEYTEFNGQNDATTLNQIGTQVVADGYDAILPIATLAAQCMANAAADAEIPVVYAAISDPAAAGLTDLPYVTGTSDALNTGFILDMMLAANPDVKTVGLLYSNSEANSTTPIAEAKAYLEGKGISYLEKTGNTADEILSAVSSLTDQVDAVFTPTDNVVMASAAAVSETLADAGIPFYTGADSFVTAGAFATCGVNYTELGSYTADMALEALATGTVPAYHVMDGGIITVNTETAEKLGLDISIFEPMAGTVKPVTTSAE
ncbi:MAG: ABC transporter substrate-binding protein [Gemmiger sp.]|nr:ABC transporter substrate-binding protein [Gemmiger sp.]